jgi:acyl dehydratase
MTEGSAITDELREMIGATTEPSIMEVERGAIRRFADAIDDPNPLYRDVEYARKAGFRDLVSPLGFFGWNIKGAGVMEMLGNIGAALARAGFPVVLDGGVDFEFFQPICAGDILTSYGKIADITERVGRTGKMLFTTFETKYLNQNGDLVAITKMTLISR